MHETQRTRCYGEPSAARAAAPYGRPAVRHVDVVAYMHLAGSAEARESAGSAEAREPAGSAEARASAGSAEESALVPQSAAGQQEATGVMPAWRSISIAARVLPAAVWAPQSARERPATLTWPAAVVVPAAVQAMAMSPWAAQAMATRPRAAQVAPPAGQVVATGPTAWAALPAAVVSVPKQVSDKCSPMPGEAPALGWVMGRSVAALAPLPATTIQRTQRTAEQTG